MNEKEIAELAAWTAKAISDAVRQEKREFDDAGEDIVREYVQSCLLDWKRGKKISLEHCSEVVTEIFTRRRNETKTEGEVLNAMMILGSKFPSFVEEQQRERDAEAARLAASMPAIKV